MFSQAEHIDLVCGLRDSLKGGSGSCRDETGGSSQVSVGSSSLVVVRDSSPPVTWVLLSSCSVLVSSSQASVVVPL